MAVLTDTTRIPSDLIAVDFDPTYNYVSAVVKNTEVGAVTIKKVTGYPVRLNAGAWELIIATEEADTDGLIVDGPPIDALAAGASTTKKYRILQRGPACIRPSGIPATDLAGATFTKADIVTAMAAVDPPVITVDEAPEVDFTAP